MRTFTTLTGSVILTLCCATASDARQHTKQPRATQSAPIYDTSDFHNNWGRDSSCFNSTGLPELYACSSHGG